LAGKRVQSSGARRSRWVTALWSVISAEVPPISASFRPPKKTAAWFATGGGRDHILLGGDNMDLTLAYASRQVGSTRSQARCLADAGFVAQLPTSQGAAVGRFGLDGRTGGGARPWSSLIGGTIRTELTREDVVRCCWTGSSPNATNPLSRGEDSRGHAGDGLPYAADPA